MNSILFLTLCLSLVRPADGWIFPSRTTTSRRCVLAFVPVTKNEDLLRVVHRDEPEEPAIIHKDTDATEKFLEEAHAEFEEMFGTVKDEKPVVGDFDLEKPYTTKMRTPREDHYLLTALDSWKKIPEVLDEDSPEKKYWDTWPLLDL